MKNLIILLLLSSIAFAQKAQTFKLTKLQKKGKLVVVNREVKTISEGNQSFIKVEDKHDEGLVWLPIKNFKFVKN